MITHAKLVAPLFGRGRAKIVFTRAFRNSKPADQMTTLQQAMVALRDAHKAAEANHRAQMQAEDHRNADAIRIRQRA